MNDELLRKSLSCLSGEDQKFLVKLLQDSGYGLVVRPEGAEEPVEVAVDEEGVVIFYDTDGDVLEVEGSPDFSAAKILDMTPGDALKRF